MKNEMVGMKIMKRGDTFTHNYVAERMPDGTWRPAQCTVTRVAQGVVYYKLEGERKAKSCFSVDDAPRFARDVKSS